MGSIRGRWLAKQGRPLYISSWNLPALLTLSPCDTGTGKATYFPSYTQSQATGQRKEGCPSHGFAFVSPLSFFLNLDLRDSALQLHSLDPCYKEFGRKLMRC